MNNEYFKDVLRLYYSRLFPFNDFYKWLSYGDEKTFSLREFSFNFDDDRFLRNQSYTNINGLKNDIKRLQPVKMDIGAVFNIEPKVSARYKFFYPTQRELIFDIDLTDYDDVRSCCSGANICVKCLDFIVIAVKILDTALREDFGFDNILWTYSGRRGVHCWVCDKRARFLRKDGRYAVASYLQLVSGGEFKKKKVKIENKIHHSVRRALDVIEPLFIETCIEKQNILETEKGVRKFLGIIAEDEMRLEVRDIFNEYTTSLEKWDAFVKFFKNQIESESEKWCKTPFLIEEIMIQYAYPRLDINVTLGMTHLLKSPFCVHPKTGRIGVPIDPKAIDDFDPWMIPTIFELMEEIDKYDEKSEKLRMSGKELKNIEDIEKTSLNKYLGIFKKFICNLERSFTAEVQIDEN